MFAKHLKRADGKIFALARFIVNIRRLLLKIARGRFVGQENDYVVHMYTYIYILIGTLPIRAKWSILTDLHTRCVCFGRCITTCGNFRRCLLMHHKYTQFDAAECVFDRIQSGRGNAISGYCDQLRLELWGIITDFWRWK